MNGLEWRNLRIKLTPTFTSGKMKMMFPIVLECADVLKKVLGPSADINDVVEIKTYFAKYTMDVIAKCAFGLDISCQTAEENEFYKVCLRMLRPTWWENVVNLISVASPKLRRFLKVS